MEQNKSILRTSIIRNCDYVLLILLTLVVSPVVVHALGDRMYGFWSLVGTFVGYYGLLDFGLSSAVSRFVSKALGKNDLDEVKGVVNTAFILFVIIGIVSLFITAGVVLFCGVFMDNPAEKDLFRIIISLIGFNIALGFPVRVFNGVLASHMRYDFIAISSIVKNIALNVSMYSLVKSGHGLIAITVVNVLASLGQYLATYLYFRLKYNMLSFSIKGFDVNRCRLLFEYSWKTFVAQIADLLRFRLDNMVVTVFINLNQVTYYAIGSRLIEYFSQFIFSTIGFLTPVFSRYDGSGDTGSLKEKYFYYTKISIMLSTFVGSSLIFYGKYFITRWMGSGFESSYYVMLILAIPYMIALMQHPTIALLYGTSNHKYFSVANMAEGIINLVLSLALVKPYGIYGVALGTAIAMIFFKLLVQPLYTCKVLQISPRVYYLNILFLNFAKSVAPLLLYFIIVYRFLQPTYISIVLFGSLQTIIYIVSMLYLLLDLRDRTKIFNLVYKRA